MVMQKLLSKARQAINDFEDINKIVFDIRKEKNTVRRM